jgi:hypothetical protein
MRSSMYRCFRGDQRIQCVGANRVRPRRNHRVQRRHRGHCVGVSLVGTYAAIIAIIAIVAPNAGAHEGRPYAMMIVVTIDCNAIHRPPSPRTLPYPSFRVFRMRTPVNPPRPAAPADLPPSPDISRRLASQCAPRTAPLPRTAAAPPLGRPAFRRPGRGSSVFIVSLASIPEDGHGRRYKGKIHPNLMNS